VSTSREGIGTAVVARAEVRPLQLAVLRPGQTITPDDLVDEPGAFYVAAYEPLGAVVGVASFLAEPHPDRPEEPEAWRLRGMASEPGHRGEGYGQAALRRGMQEAAHRGGRLLWCNARTVAVGFYERLGFVREGVEFVTGTGIPHYRMHRPLP